MQRYNLLTEPLIGVGYESGKKESLTLPGVLAKLSRDDIESFTALQPHQEQAWYCFLVQLAAMAMHDCGAETIEAEETEWAQRLRSLTKEYPADEPWCMVVEDLGKPGFMQTPVPEGDLKGYAGWFEAPDEIDILIVAKAHDVKMLRIKTPENENWIYALINLQTLQGFLGRGNYGIVRMNGGFANRPFFGYSKSDTIGEEFRRDTEVLLRHHLALCEKFGYNGTDGVKLIWLRPWNGDEQLLLTMLDPYFLEICRRVRFDVEMETGRLVCRTANTNGYRINTTSINGITGDPWNVIRKDEGKSLSLSGNGFTYKLLREILFEPGFNLPPCLEFQTGETGEWLLIANGFVRGQGVTEGLHRRVVPIPGRIRFMFNSPGGQEMLAKISKAMLDDVRNFADKVFKMAICSLLQPEREKFDFKDARPQKWTRRLDSEIDRIYFERLWNYSEGDQEKNREDWIAELRRLGEKLLIEAFDSIPIAAVRKYKTISSAEGRFNGGFYNAFPFMKKQTKGGEHA